MQSTVRELKDNPVVYISVVAVVALVLCFGAFFTVIGATQPFDSLVNKPNNSTSPSAAVSVSVAPSPSLYTSSSLSSSPSPIVSPSPPQVNETETNLSKFLLIHTTDIHGWVGGHPHEENLDADIGDFASLMEHLLSRTDRNVLLFDSGDLVEGTGFSDVTEVHGKELFPIYQTIPGFAALTIGNHDIGREDTVELMEQEFIPFFNDDVEGSRGQFLTGNSHLKTNESDSFVGKPYSIRQAPTGERLMLLGFLYDFKFPASNTVVRNVTDALQESWFQEAMAKEFDLAVVTAHIDPLGDGPLIDLIISAIHENHPSVPVIFLAGHRHILHHEAKDNNQTHIIESGRYFEHIGVVQFDLHDGQIENFALDFMETSLSNFYELSETTAESFLTERGNQTKQMIRQVQTQYGLDTVLGCSYLKYRTAARFSEEDSLYSLYLNEVIPKAVAQNGSNTPFAMCNPSTLRYDLYEGEVTLNDVITVNPFKDVYYYFTLNGTELNLFIADMYSTSEGSVGKTLHHRNIQAGLASEEEHKLFYSSEDIIEEQVYDLICAEYDAVGVEAGLALLFPNREDLAKRLYPTTENSTTAWRVYILQYMPCE